jgi:hypothetical protein
MIHIDRGNGVGFLTWLQWHVLKPEVHQQWKSINQLVNKKLCSEGERAALGLTLTDYFRIRCDRLKVLNVILLPLSKKKNTKLHLG